MQATHLNDLRTFVAVYQAGSFTAAAARLKVQSARIRAVFEMFIEESARFL